MTWQEELARRFVEAIERYVDITTNPLKEIQSNSEAGEKKVEYGK
jgi:hypothetical protein